MKIIKYTTVVLVVAALLAGALYFSDPVFWYRYFNVRKLDNYIEHPFPTVERMFPQEEVMGAPLPAAIPVAGDGQRTVSADVLKIAEETAKAFNSSSLIYIHRGQIQYENYWPEQVRKGPVYAFSMSKTVAALLVGIAIEQGLIDSVDDPVGKYIEEWQDHRRGDEITLRHLLTMSSGFEPTPYFSTNPFWKGQQRQIGTNLTKAALSYELVEEPGSKWEYNGTNTFLLGLIVSRRAGMRYTEFLSENLWQPVGNATAHMWMDREGGVPRTFVGLYAAPMDWARLGLLMLNRGRVGDRQVVPGSWVEAMLQPAQTAPYYGFQIWLAVPDQLDKPPGDYYLFRGFGGQVVFVHPQSETVIVRTGPIGNESAEFMNALPGLVAERQAVE